MRTAIRLFATFPYLRKRKRWNNYSGKEIFCGLSERTRRKCPVPGKIAKEEEERQIQPGVEGECLSLLLGGCVKATCYAGEFLLANAMPIKYDSPFYFSSAGKTYLRHNSFLYRTVLA